MLLISKHSETLIFHSFFTNRHQPTSYTTTVAAAAAAFPHRMSRSFYSRRPFWTRHTPHAATTTTTTMEPSTSIAECRELVRSGARILALCGAGLSTASGLPTFRGAGGLWRNHEPTSLATPEAFAVDPGLVWLFYAWRRHMALKANPNRAHYALAELAKWKKGFMCLSQNVDGELSGLLTSDRPGRWGEGGGGGSCAYTVMS